jgi:hypothetical protein
MQQCCANLFRYPEANHKFMENTQQTYFRHPPIDTKNFWTFVKKLTAYSSQFTAYG